VTTCPVREFTAEVEDILAWFYRTHEIDAGLAGGRWRLSQLPRAGGIEDQEARLLEALDHCRAVQNAMLAERREATAAQREARAFHQKHIH
jgi:hypothetical protein